MKIFNTDPELPYTKTRISAEGSQRDINSVLARYNITTILWKTDYDNGHVELAFQFGSKFLHVDTPELSVRIKPPTIWMKKGRGYNKTEEIDWKTSMRILYWYLKNKLAMVFAMQSSPISAFLPHIVVDGQKTTVEEVILPKLYDAEGRKRLPQITFGREG